MVKVLVMSHRARRIWIFRKFCREAEQKAIPLGQPNRENCFIPSHAAFRHSQRAEVGIEVGMKGKEK
ncbi:hypothetical protein [Mesorhizobium sp.]|uniref:hypothetical protein n=1 Tax=Mesorhizobium sp. TaxID=1871066 RepID=UPI0011FFED37|nr:hypothetical protein [Mesorhizobium sp.]TIL42600.1 MAG: hypothetical protein E5Y86_26670 [Mesorhizobium sp.]